MAHRVHPALQDQQGRVEVLVYLDQTEPPERQALLGQRDNKETRVFKVNQDRQDLRAPRVQPVQLDLLAHQDSQVFQVRQVQMVRPAFPEDLDQMDPRDPLDHQATAEQTECLEHQGTTEDRDCRVPRVHQESLERLEQPEAVAQRVHQGLKVRMERRDLKELAGHRDRQE